MGDWTKPLFNRYDPYVIKGKLDEYITEELNTGRKFTQTFEYSNLKLLIGLIAVLFTTLAHVYEYVFHAHFPKDYDITVICVIGYFLFNFVYQIFEYFYEKETFYQGNPNITGIKSVDLASTIAKFDHFYVITLYIYSEEEQIKSVEIKKSVAELFSEDGYMVKSRGQRLVQEIVSEIRKKLN